MKEHGVNNLATFMLLIKTLCYVLSETNEKKTAVLAIIVRQKNTCKLHIFGKICDLLSGGCRKQEFLLIA